MGTCALLIAPSFGKIGETPLGNTYLDPKETRALIGKSDDKTVEICYKNSMMQKLYALIYIFNKLIDRTVNDSYIKLS